MSALEIRALKAFGRQILGDATRDLDLLRAIDATLDTLDIELGRVEQLNHAAERFIELIRTATAPIESDVDLVALFDLARDPVGEAHSLLKRRQQSAVNDSDLRDDDGIVEAYSCLIEATAEFHNHLNTLSWMIGEHNADFDKPTGVAYSNVEDMFKDLGV
jgi:hypothetical protein